MASCKRYVCGTCEFSIQAWSDGNPYYLDEHGQKQYAYHPNHEALDKCIGNDAPHLCLHCGEEFNVDSRAPNPSCPTCGSKDIAATYQLDGRTCPSCKAGVFATDPNFFVIS